MHGDSSDWWNSTVVVPAVYKEWHGGGPPAYLKVQYPVYLYQRLNASQPCMCANRGYESAVYFTFIAQHYNQLPLYSVFIQADWIFQTKTSGGHGFTFWQPRCSSQGSNLPWADYMPLGGRRSVWPPRCVQRSVAWYTHFVGRKNEHLVEACARELLRILDVPVPVRGYNRSQPLDVTFYTNMNFLVSRRRLQHYRHAAWRTLAHRFIEEGMCMPQTVANATAEALVAAPPPPPLPPDASASSAPGGADDFLGVVDSPRFAKITLGMATELLQQTIFNFNPLEHGPVPAVPADRDHCDTPAKTNC